MKQNSWQREFLWCPQHTFAVCPFRRKPSSSLWIRPRALSGDAHGQPCPCFQLSCHFLPWRGFGWTQYVSGPDGTAVVCSICKSKAYSEIEGGWGWKVASWTLLLVEESLRGRVYLSLSHPDLMAPWLSLLVTQAGSPCCPIWPLSSLLREPAERHVEIIALPLHSRGFIGSCPCFRMTSSAHWLLPHTVQIRLLRNPPKAQNSGTKAFSVYSHPTMQTGLQLLLFLLFWLSRGFLSPLTLMCQDSLLHFSTDWWVVWWACSWGAIPPPWCHSRPVPPS